jgi:hypothetical protein
VHAAVGSPLVAPYKPAVQLVQVPEACKLYLPGGHTLTDRLKVPGGQAYPAGHGPLQDALVRPLMAPNLPTGHGPLQAATVMGVVPPYRPTPQSVHTPAPAREYLPSGHSNAVAVDDPAAHAYPAAQFPVHVATAIAVVPPKRPAGHREHDPSPTRLYRPVGHVNAVALVDPAAHAYPAVQFAVQVDTVRPAVDPNRPGSQRPVQAAEGRPAVAP